MVMLSRLRRFELVDTQHRRAKLTDLAVALLEDDYPPVTRLLFRKPDKSEWSLPWSEVEQIDARACQIKVKDLEQAQSIAPDAPKKDVLLAHGIIDALVLDLQNRRATRANDLWLEEADNQLRLRGWHGDICRAPAPARR